MNTTRTLIIVAGIVIAMVAANTGFAQKSEENDVQVIAQVNKHEQKAIKHEQKAMKHEQKAVKREQHVVKHKQKEMQKIEMKSAIYPKIKVHPETRVKPVAKYKNKTEKVEEKTEKTEEVSEDN